MRHNVNFYSLTTHTTPTMCVLIFIDKSFLVRHIFVVVVVDDDVCVLRVSCLS